MVSFVASVGEDGHIGARDSSHLPWNIALEEPNKQTDEQAVLGKQVVSAPLSKVR